MAGVGRIKGSKNRSTVIRKERAEMGMMLADKMRRTPLQIILAVADGAPHDEITDRQFEAAVAAAPYCHARLQAVAMVSPPDPHGARREVLGKLDYHARKQIEGILAAADAGIVDGVAEEVENE